MSDADLVRALRERAEQAERERDEARAEVERLCQLKAEWAETCAVALQARDEARAERDEAVALLREIDEWFRQEGAFPDYIQARLDALLERQQ